MAPQTTITPLTGLGQAKPAKTVDTAKTLAGMVKTLDGLLETAPAGNTSHELSMALFYVLRAQKLVLEANAAALGRTMVVRHAN